MCTNTDSSEGKYFKRFTTAGDISRLQTRYIYSLTDFISLNAKVKPRSDYRLGLATIKSPFIRNSQTYRCKMTLFVASRRRLVSRAQVASRRFIQIILKKHRLV